jgi:hypothetical protein
MESFRERGVVRAMAVASAFFEVETGAAAVVARSFE